MITGIIATFLYCISPSSFLINSWYSTTFSCSFSFSRVLNDYVTSVMWYSPVSLSKIIISVCCVQVYGRFVQRNPTLSLHCHFLSRFLVCVYITWVQLTIHIFCTPPNERPHQLYHVDIAGIASGANILHSTTTC